jgi:hypothetical protein
MRTHCAVQTAVHKCRSVTGDMSMMHLCTVQLRQYSSKFQRYGLYVHLPTYNTGMVIE